MAQHEARNQVVNWLNDALGMEESLVQVLSNHSSDAKDDPSMKQMIDDHVEVTRRHADMVRSRVKALGGSPSTMKTAVGKVQGWFQGVSTGAAGDELVKNTLADYAAEHFEVACYSALIDAARETGDDETVMICEEIRSDELDMADRLFRALPTAVADFMARKEQKAA